VTGKCGRRLMQLPDGLKETIRYWEFKEEAPDFAVWRIYFARSYGPVARRTVGCR
jgi:hypothetical protein